MMSQSDSGDCPPTTDTGQSSTPVDTSGDINCTKYSGSLNNRNLTNLENDMEDMDSTDELDDMDDLDAVDSKQRHSSNGETGYMSGLETNLTGLANNAAMFIEDDKRKRRAIANSNERRRMQSINAGFQTLKSLIPHSSGEKLSKACILQRSADFMQFLSNEKDKLSNKLQVAMKLIEANGLSSQFQSDHQSNLKQQVQVSNSSMNFTASKSTSTTKINKQYVSSYSNSIPAAAAAVPSVPASTQPTQSSLLSSALVDCGNGQGFPSNVTNVLTTSSDEAAQPVVGQNVEMIAPSVQVNPVSMPIQTLSASLTRTQVQTLSEPCSATSGNAGVTTTNVIDSNSDVFKAKLITPISKSMLTKCTNNTNETATILSEPSNCNILINTGQLTSTDMQPLTNLITTSSLPQHHQIKSLTETAPNLLSNLLIVNTDSAQPRLSTFEVKTSETNCTMLQVQMELAKEKQPIQPPPQTLTLTTTTTSEQEKPKEPQIVEMHQSDNTKCDYKLNTGELVALLNDIKDQNPSIDVSSTTSLILKSILSGNISLPQLGSKEVAVAAAPMTDTITKQEKSKESKINSMLKRKDNLMSEIFKTGGPQRDQKLENSNIQHRLKVDIGFENLVKESNSSRGDLESNILIASSKINDQEKLSVCRTNNKYQKNNSECQNLTNNHLKNASNVNKSSRSNSIDQLIAAAAVTAHSSACMSPLSPSNSPTGAVRHPGDSNNQSDLDPTLNELTVSRKNLNTIVEAIFHVEGTSRLDELVDHNQIYKYPNSLPSSSYTASSTSCIEHQQQQQKPPKKRKYTTEDITQTQDEQQSCQVVKQSNQFISDYYNNNNHSINSNKSDQCQNINKLLANKMPVYRMTNPIANNLETFNKIDELETGKKSVNESNNTGKNGNKKRANLVGLLVTS